MKSIVTTLILTSTLIAGTNSFKAEPAYSSNTVFLCEFIDNAPTTVARTQQRPDPVEIVRWRSSPWFDTLYPPEKRCQEVAGRLQTYYACGFLTEFLEVTDSSFSPFMVETTTFSWIDEPFPVIYVRVSPQRGDSRCASQRPQDGKLLLFMLEPSADTRTVTNQLEEIRRGAGEPIVTGSGAITN